MVFETWIIDADNNLVMLMSSLDVITNNKVAEELLKGYFASVHTPEHIFNDEYWNNLTPETIIYWRFFCEHIDRNTESDVGDFMPELTVFASLLKT